jgi:hypothetical protein
LVAIPVFLMLSGALPASQDGRVNLQAAALVEFQNNLQAYLRLRNELSDRLTPLSSTPSAAELAARQESLAEALRANRKTARPGDVIPAVVGALVRQAVNEDMRRRSAADKRGAFEEVPNGPVPQVNQTYPADAALATVPPLLLANLPRLPDNLQYRFYARHIVILDGDAEIVVDYVPNALPPH